MHCVHLEKRLGKDESLFMVAVRTIRVSEATQFLDTRQLFIGVMVK